MKVRKAVVTAAGRSQRLLPLQRFVDRDGIEKTALQIIVEEVTSAGVEEVCIIVCPGDQDAYRAAAGEHAARLHFMEQHQPRGYGDAVMRAASFVGGEPFVHLVGDHLYVSKSDKRCAEQLVEAATAQSCAVSAVQATRESMLPFYGTVGGRRVPRADRLYEIETVMEKPTPTQAEQSLIVPGLRAGHYLCMFGMHVLTPAVMDTLGQLLSSTAPGQTVQLTHALEKLPGRERYLALEVEGYRYNIGVKYGLLTAQLALGLAGADREEILTQITELLAQRQRQG